MTTKNQEKIIPYYMSYDEASSKKYCLAYDKDTTGRKGYFGTNVFIEFIKIIEKINKCKQRIFYQVITDDTPKMYIDLDNIYVPIDKVDLLINRFLCVINFVLEKNITIEDLQIYHRDTTDNIIKSLHIIFNKFKMKKTDILKVINYMKLYSPARIQIQENGLYVPNELHNIDTTIYSKNRLLNLPNNTKSKYYQNAIDDKMRFKDGKIKEIEKPKYLKDTKQQNNDPKNYICNYTKNATLIETPALKEVVFNVMEDVLSKVEQKFLVSKDNLSINNNNNNNNATITDIPIFHIETPLDLYEYITFNLPIEFFNNSNDWKMMTNILKKYKLSKEYYKLYNEVSVKHAKKSNWTISSNNIYFSNILTEDVKAGIPTFIKLVNKYINCIINIVPDKQIYEWISSKTNISVKVIGNLYKKPEKQTTNKKQQEQFLKLDDIYTFNYNTTHLFKGKEIIGNYYTEVKYKQYYENEKTHYENEVDNMIKAIPLIDKFNKISLTDTQKILLAINASWGSRKTSIAMLEIIKYAHSNLDLELRIIIITENNSLNRELTSVLNEHSELKGVNFISHLDADKFYKEQKNNSQVSHLICSMESMYKIEPTDNDILILDEYETLLNHIESTTITNKYKTYIKLKQLIQNSLKVCILDADLSTTRINFMKQLRPNDKLEFINITFNKFKNFKIFIGYCEEKAYDLLDPMKDAVEDNKRIVLASASQRKAELLFLSLQEHFNKNDDVKILLIDRHAEARLSCKGNIIHIKKDDIIDNLREFIITQKITIFIYTPSIKTGVSFNDLYFHKIYAYGTPKSLCVREFSQMLFRVRELIDEEVIISLSNNLYTSKPNVLYNQVLNYIKKPIQLLISYEIFNTTQDKEKITNTEINVDTNYLTLRVINENERYNSVSRYNQSLITHLKYCHNLNVSFITGYKNDCLTEIPEIEDENDIFINEIVKAELINANKYFSEKDKLSSAEIVKYKFFNVYYYIEGITGKIDYDTDIYDIINKACFYKKYYIDKTIRNAYNNIKTIAYIIPDELEKQFNNDIYNIISNENTINKKEENINKTIISYQLLNFIGTDITSLPYSITNRKIEDLLTSVNGREFMKKLQNFLENHSIENKNYVKNLNKIKSQEEGKDYVSSSIFIIKNILKHFNISVKYLDPKNTTSPSNKLQFTLPNFRYSNTDKQTIIHHINTKKQTNKKLDHLTAQKIDINELKSISKKVFIELLDKVNSNNKTIKNTTLLYKEQKATKYKNGFTNKRKHKLYKNEVKLFKQQEQVINENLSLKLNDLFIYYTSYKIKLNRKTKNLSKQIINKTKLQEEVIPNFFTELNKYFIEKHSPVIINTEQYDTIINNMCNELEQELNTDNVKMIKQPEFKGGHIDDTDDEDDYEYDDCSNDDNSYSVVDEETDHKQDTAKQNLINKIKLRIETIENYCDDNDLLQDEKNKLYNRLEELQ